METVETNDTKGWVIGAVVLIVVIVGGWWMIKNGKASSSVVGKETAKTETAAGDNYPVDAEGTVAVGANAAVARVSATVAAAGEKVSVENQAAGGSVAVASMNLTKASWIAIKDGKGILGAGWFPAVATAGSVPLLRKTAASGTYEAVIYVDDGDKQFDLHKDALVEGVASSFTAK